MKKNSRKVISLLMSIVMMFALVQPQLLMSVVGEETELIGGGNNANTENNEKDEILKGAIDPVTATFSTWVDVANAAQLGTDYVLDTSSNLTINTAKGLAWFASSVNGTLIDQNGDAIPAKRYSGKIVSLSGDINLDIGLVEGYGGSEAGEQNQMANTVNELNSWQAISLSWATPFGGTFDGNGNEISGVYINLPDEYYQGLFGYSEEGEITNVGVVNSHIIGYNYVGGIVGELFGNVTNVYSNSQIIGEDYVGGIVGKNEGRVENSYNAGNVAVKGNSDNNQIGAVVGINIASVRSNYYLTGTADKGVGNETENSENTLAKIEEDMKSTAFADTLNEWVENETSSNYNTWKSVSSSYPVFAEKYEIPVNEWIKFARTAIEDTDYELDTNGNLTINTIKGLAWFASSVNGTLIDENGIAIYPNSYEGKTIILKANTEFDLTKAGIGSYTGNGNEMGQNIDEWNSWQAIGTEENSFNGVFNGNFNEISGVYINLHEENYQGLFGYSEGEITDVGVVNSHINGEDNIGGIVGESYGNVTNAYSNSQVLGDDYVGGIVGNNEGSIKNSYNLGEVTATSYNQAFVGGITGDNNSEVINCYNVGKIFAIGDGGDHKVGGIVGSNSGNLIENCYYLASSASVGTDSLESDDLTTKSMTESEMKSAEFVETLNNGVKNINELGLLTWKSEANSYPIFGEPFTDIIENRWITFANTAVSGEDYVLDADDNLTINTVIGLAWFASSVNGTLIDENGDAVEANDYREKTVTLKANTEFDLTKAGIENYTGSGNEMGQNIDEWNSWQAIGTNSNTLFKGSFNGNGNEISGVYINLPNEFFQGLFGISGGEIINVGLINSHIIGSTYVGGIVGGNDGSIINSYNMGEVTATLNEYAKVGGISGDNYREIINCYNVGKVFAIGADGYHEVGGIVGYNDDAYVLDCYYLDSSASIGIGSLESDNFRTIAMTENEMKSSEFVETLNNGVKNINELGILTWKGEANAYPTFGEPFTEILTENLWVTFANTAILDEDYVLNADDNLTINTVKGLAWFASSVNGTLKDENGQLILPNSYDGKTVTLKANTEFDLTTANIDGYSGTGNQMSTGVYFWNSWQAIGTDENKFIGVFNGNGSEISGVYINLPSNDYQGLFGYSSGEITNVGVVNSHIIGYNNVGGIVGESYGTVSNVYSNSQILGEDYVGGIVGDNNDEGTVMNSYNLGEVTATLNEYAYVGGITGENDSEVINCYNVGKVFAIGAGGNHKAGGIVGSNSDNLIENCYYLDSSASVGNGSLESDNFMTIAMTESEMKSSEFVETLNYGVKAINELGILTWKGEANAYPTFGEPFTDLITENLWITFANTAILDEDYVLDTDGNLTINTVKGLAWFASSVNGTLTDENGQLILPNSYDGKTVTLKANTEFDLTTANIDGYSGTGNQMSNWVNFWNSWQAIGTESDPFDGKFNGNDNEISGVFIGGIPLEYQGLFGYTEKNATVENVHIVNSHIIGMEDVAGVVGYNIGLVTNCSSTAQVHTYENNAGGIVGYNSGAIDNCYNTGEVGSETENVGGVVGYNSGEIFNSFNAGNISGDYDVGGVVGDNDNMVYNVYNIGKVTGSDYVGGIVGENDILYNSYNKGEVVATGNDGVFVGGVAGYNYYGVENCYNVGNVSATGVYGENFVGGVIGYDEVLDYSVNEYLYYLNTTATSGIGNDTANTKGTIPMSDAQMQDSNDLLVKLNEWVSAEETNGNTVEFSNWAKVSTEPYPVLGDLPIVYQIEITNGTVSQAFAKEDETITLTANAIDGKKFTSWSGLDGITIVEGSAATATVKFTMPAKKVDVTALYEDVIYNINVTNGTANPVSAKMEETVTLTANTVDGKEFMSWSGLDGLTIVEGSATTATVKFKMPAKNVDVSVNYVDIYEITFNLQGGSSNNSTTEIKVETNKNGIVTFPSTPSKDKNIFVGWFTEMTGGVEVTSITSFTENTTIYARWEETSLIPQTLNFDDNSVSKVIGDAVFTNKLSGAMTSISFISSNEDVATVDANGNVTIVGEAGTAIITATAVETEVYAAASVNYTITVNTVGGESLEELQDYLASFTGDFDDLDKVFFNGVELLVTFGADRSTAYLSGYPKNSTTIIGEVTQGSIVIKLYSEFLKTLPQANYNLSVSLRSAPNSLAGTTIVPVPAASTVDPSPTPGPTTTPDGETPETGDDNGIFVMMFGALMLLTFAGIVFVLKAKQNKSKNYGR